MMWEPGLSAAALSRISYFHGEADELHSSVGQFLQGVSVWCLNSCFAPYRSKKHVNERCSDLPTYEILTGIDDCSCRDFMSR